MNHDVTVYVSPSCNWNGAPKGAKLAMTTHDAAQAVKGFKRPLFLWHRGEDHRRGPGYPAPTERP